MDSSTASGGLQLGALLTGLGGGLALFLYGMRKMTESLKTVAGGGMKSLLAKLTTNRFTAALAGILITAVIQSSSVTTVLVVGFISAGLLTLSQSIGVILGASVGTTVTAQIIAFKVTQYALVFIAVGFLMELTARKEAIKHYGIMLMGLGLLFFGMELMSQATYPLRSYTPFIELMQSMKNPLFGILIGALFTAVVQSSSATTGVVIVLAGQGFISLNAGIALVFGANVGTCITALLATIGKPREAVRAAVVHVVYKVLGVLLWLAFIPQLAEVVRGFSPSAPELEGMARLAAETPRQIANAHTFFNVANMLLFIGFTGPLARIAQKIVPDRPEDASEGIKPRFLEAYFLQTPALALDQVRLELGRLGELTLDMARRAFSAVTGGGKEELATLRNMDQDINSLHGEIIAYLGKLSLKDLVEPQPRQLYEYIGAANYIENIGDIVEMNLVANAEDRLDAGMTLSPATREALAPLHQQACEAIARALEALAEGNADKAREVSESKKEFNRLADQARNRLAQQLSAGAEEMTGFRHEADLIEDLKRLHTLARRIARVLEDIHSPDEKPQPTAAPEAA